MTSYKFVNAFLTHTPSGLPNRAEDVTVWGKYWGWRCEVQQLQGELLSFSSSLMLWLLTYSFMPLSAHLSYILVKNSFINFSLINQTVNGAPGLQTKFNMTSCDKGQTDKLSLQLNMAHNNIIYVSMNQN